MTTAVDNFDDVYSANLIGLWDFLASDPEADTGLDDGIAQDGEFENGAKAQGDQLVTSGNCDQHFAVEGNDAPFDLAQGTIIVRFSQDSHCGSKPDSLVTRGEFDDRATEGFLDIRVTASGAVEVLHIDGGTQITAKTADGFFAAGDDVEVFYAWSDTGGALKVVNHSTGTEEVVDIAEALSLDIGDADTSFTFAARTKDDDEVDHEFDGKIDYVAVYDDNVATGPMGDGIVDGTAGDDVIDLAYTGDPQGDMIDNGDAILPGQGPDDDIVDALAGDDVISSEQGDDTVYAGEGADTVSGGAGDDTIYGDSTLSGAPTNVREVFKWSDAPDPDDGGQVDNDDDLSGGFTLNTGSVDVAFSVLNASAGVNSTFDTTTQATAGIDADGNPVDPGSAFEGKTSTASQSADYALAFSAEVMNVSFRLNDIDGDGVVRVTAYDAQGNPVQVVLTGGDNLVLTDTDAVPGADTAAQATSADNYALPDEEDNSVLVEIAGPIARIEVAIDQTGPSASAIDITDIYFDAPAGMGEGDVLFGDDGQDTIYGEAGADLLIGGADGDFLYGGDDADVIGGGVGDVATGGEGGDDRDTLIAGGLATVQWQGGDPASEAGTITYYDANLNVIGTSTFTEMESVLAIDVSSGNSTFLSGNSLNGLVEGTTGNDLIDTAYTGDPEGDMIDNMDALLPLTGDQDIALGFDGNDEIYGGLEEDLLFGDLGNDTIYGQEGTDGLSGGEGDDVLHGGEGRDIVAGGDGNDTISGDSDVATDGGDLLYGNFGDDTFVDIGTDDFIDGGEDPDGKDMDTLDLTGAGETVNPGGGYATVTYDPTNSETGTVHFFDAGGTETGTASFQNIEKVIGAQICFTPGMVIATPQGERRVETLQVGDRVMTRDNGIQDIRWIGRRGLTGADLTAAPHLRPVRIAAGSLGDGLPERDLYLSPNHRVLIANERASLYFEEPEVLVACKHLVGQPGIDTVNVPQTSYIHLLFDNHEVILSNGAWTESFQPGDYSMAGLGNDQRHEIYELFPELEHEKGLMEYTAARRALKRFEARALLS